MGVCSLCDRQFQFYMMEFCSFHAGEPEYPNIQFKNSTLPMGEYPCCGEVALRFQPLFQSSLGCKVRDHKVKVRTEREEEMYRTAITHRDIICVRWRHDTSERTRLIILVTVSSYKRNQPNSLKTISDANSISLPSPKSTEVRFTV